MPRRGHQPQSFNRFIIVGTFSLFCGFLLVFVVSWFFSWLTACEGLESFDRPHHSGSIDVMEYEHGGFWCLSILISRHFRASARCALLIDVHCVYNNATWVLLRQILIAIL